MPPQLTLLPYRLPLRRPWRTARGLWEERVGWLVRAEACGTAGYGDCAPLPEAGTEDAQRAERRLRHWCERTREGSDALLAALTAASAADSPAADCAVETALLDLAARRQGLPLRRLLAADAPDRVAVNAMLGAAAEAEPAAAQRALDAGFRVLKLKVGAADIDMELRRIRALAALLSPDARLRLDANGAWDEATAKQWIHALTGSPIDCIEEPLAQPDAQTLARLQDAAEFSLALDESLRTSTPPAEVVDKPLALDARGGGGTGFQSASRAQGDALGSSSSRFRDIEEPLPPVRRLVLKPAVMGGLRRTLSLARQARAGGREVVVTSLIESAAGLWAAAQLAAATGSRLAHGLATADWLAANLGTPPAVQGGEIRLPETAGSGFEPFAAASQQEP
jgi:o-succinylbenzoate synthase